MRLSRRSEYGLRALVDLVREGDTGPVALGSLAKRNNLPAKFLEQIMATLKHGGIVRTTLGAHGGYAMSTDPSTVTIG
ncbi:MAG TPA: Rrf2 family transcriptional regulator, partial [Methylomirabilota bacterium]|nr:Rrf2 family transcriptional regulator [Methylomirabilota bacterium]